MSSENFDNVLHDLKNITDMDFSNLETYQIPTLVMKAMEMVEKVQGLSGALKKELVIKVVTQIIDESDISGDFEPFVLSMVPDLIDQFVEVDQGHLKINTNLKNRFVTMFKSVGKLFSSCLGSCAGCKGCKGC